MLIVNPVASRVTTSLVAAVERELGDVETQLTRGAWDAAELAAVASERADRLFVFSGDGGYNEVVNGVASGVAVGFIPGGATSVLPRALGLPRDAVECARVIARSSRRRTISLGRVNGRRFTFSAGLGLDAELVRAVDGRGRNRGRRAGDLAFAVELTRILARRRGRFKPGLTIANRGRAAFALVANCDPYTYVGKAPVHVAPTATFEGGIELVAPVELTPARLPYAALSVLARPRHLAASWILHVPDADELFVQCDRPFPLQTDGEDLGDVLDARFVAERGALTVIVG